MKKEKKTKVYSTRYSQAVTHPSTNRARGCLTSVILIARVLIHDTGYILHPSIEHFHNIPFSLFSLFFKVVICGKYINLNKITKIEHISLKFNRLLIFVILYRLQCKIEGHAV